MTDKEFICLGCKWSEAVSENEVYCGKVGFACNGIQNRPTHFCEEHEEQEG